MMRKLFALVVLAGLAGCGPQSGPPLAPLNAATAPPPGPTTTIIGPDNNRISCTNYSGAVCPQP